MAHANDDLRGSWWRTTLQLRVVFILAVAALGCPSTGCGGGERVAPPTAVLASFTASGTLPATDSVRLKGGSFSGETVTVQVVIGGPTTSDDIYAFAFDLELSDPTVVGYRADSAVVGPALVADLSEGQSTIVQAKQEGNRVVVGISKRGGGRGNAVLSGESAVVNLTFEVRKVGVSSVRLVGSPSQPPSALDSALNRIESVSFDSAPATIRGQ